jgi:hypothetical protein
MRRVELEHKIQMAHIFRQALFRRVPYPDVKGSEWKTILGRLETILARRGLRDRRILLG